MKKPRFLWITDPWDTLDHARDTSLRLAQEAYLLGVDSSWCDVRSIRWQEDRVLVDAYEIKSIGPGRTSAEIILGAPIACSPTEFTSLQYRTDPPVDLAYQHPLQLLRLAIQGRDDVELVNPISALLLSNEKLEASQLPELMPPTVVASQWEPLEAFGLDEGKTVLKPLHLAQSKGIEMLDWTTPQGEKDARAKIEAATAGFERPVLLQRYLKGIAKGETRLWFLDGKLLASARKLPLQGDFRVDIDRGSRIVPHRVTLSEMKAAARIGKLLQQLGVRMAAVDLIDGYVTDFNITSPGLITQIEKATGENLARKIIRALLKPAPVRIKRSARKPRAASSPARAPSKRRKRSTPRKRRS